MSSLSTANSEAPNSASASANAAAADARRSASAASHTAAVKRRERAAQWHLLFIAVVVLGLGILLADLWLPTEHKRKLGYVAARIAVNAMLQRNNRQKEQRDCRADAPGELCARRDAHFRSALPKIADAPSSTTAMYRTA